MLLSLFRNNLSNYFIIIENESKYAFIKILSDTFIKSQMSLLYQSLSEKGGRKKMQNIKKMQIEKKDAKTKIAINKNENDQKYKNHKP